MKINYPLLVLVIGTFDIGATEFSPVGLLPVIARDMGVSIPVVGTLISTYAVGVVVGAPLVMLLFFHRARRSVLILLMVIFTLGNVLSVIAPDYMTLMFSRILTSLDHRISFGLGSVVAASVVPKHKRASAVVTMFMGLTLANTGDVSAVTWSGETIGQRILFLATAGLGVISMVGLSLSLSKGGARARPEARKELTVSVRPQMLSVLLTTVLGVGAMFTFYTYISPVLQNITHATSAFATVMLVLIGAGFSIDNYSGGKLVDCSASGTLKGFLSLLMVTMLATPFLACDEFSMAIGMMVRGAVTFAAVPPLQMRVVRVANEVPGLSSSVSIGVFNLGNVLGATAGGAVVSAGLGYSFAPVMGTIIAGLALLLAFIPARK